MQSIKEIGDKCFGCGSCYSKCSQKAINLKYKNGFLYPVIDKSCILCGQCLKVCPVVNTQQGTKPNCSIVLYANNDEIYEKSSSGGFFGVVAHYFIKEKKGVVIGAALVDGCKVEHIIIEDELEVDRLQGSKYVQSDTHYVYTYVFDALKKGKYVLFCGTPCQVAALRLRFPNEEKLFLIDIVCHGVPSPVLLKNHVTKNILPGDSVKEIAFRTKDKFDRYGFNLVVTGEKNKKVISGLVDPYYRLFLKNASFRECCYSCKFAKRERLGDITISDCNNSEKYTVFSRNKTLSTIYIVSQKGDKLFKCVKDEFNMKYADVEYEANANAQMNYPSSRPNFRNDLYPCEADKIAAYTDKFLGKVTVKTRVKARLKRTIPESNRIWMIKTVMRFLGK